MLIDGWVVALNILVVFVLLYVIYRKKMQLDTTQYTFNSMSDFAALCIDDIKEYVTRDEPLYEKLTLMKKSWEYKVDELHTLQRASGVEPWGMKDEAKRLSM